MSAGAVLAVPHEAEDRANKARTASVAGKANLVRQIDWRIGPNSGTVLPEQSAYRPVWLDPRRVRSNAATLVGLIYSEGCRLRLGDLL